MRAAPLAIVLLPILLAAPSMAVGDVIQPGDRMLLGGSTQCTLSYVFDGVAGSEGRVFFSIASHCVGALGQVIATDNYPAFGEVVYKGAAGQTETDIALIEVYSAFHDAVVPDVRGHPGFPTGVATAGTTATGDLVVMSGWGTGFGNLQQTREMRQGVLLRHTEAVARIEGPVTPGDSGGPWTLADGRALAIVSKIVVGFSCCDSVDAGVWQEGPTVENILATAADSGLPVALRTA